MIKIDESPKTLMHALTRNSQLYGKRIAIRERNYGIWQEQTWSDVHADVLAVAAALELHGVLPHQAVTVIGDDYACFIFHQLFPQLRLLGHVLFW